MNEAWYVGEKLGKMDAWMDGQQPCNHGKLLQDEEFSRFEFTVVAV